MCAVDEFESGVIKRHELTREDKELDRVKHIRALGCQTGPIFLTYRDQPVLDMIVGAAMTSTPLYDFADESGVRQTVWEVVRHDAVDALRAMLGQIPCAYIADGQMCIRDSARTTRSSGPCSRSSRAQAPSRSSRTCRAAFSPCRST